MKIDDKHTVGGFCSVKPEQRRDFGSGINSVRLEAVIRQDKKWANGTRLHYAFFDGAGDDDSGLDLNARVRVRLRKCRTCHVRARLFFSGNSSPPAVMVH